MKLEENFNFHKVFVIAAIVIGIGFFLFSLIFSRIMDESGMDESGMDESGMKTTAREIPEQKGREKVVGTLGHSAIQRPRLPSEADIEAAIAALESLGTVESLDRWVESVSDETNSEPQVADGSNNVPLSYAEKLAQRYLFISETQEFQEASDNFANFPKLKLGTLDTSAKDALEEHDRNPYAMFGYTQDEYESGMDLPAEEYEILIAEGKRLRQEVDAEMERNASIVNEYNRKQAELHQRRLDVLGMTNEEFEIALDEYDRLRELGELERLRKL